jgi:hypothetical protein
MGNAHDDQTVTPTSALATDRTQTVICDGRLEGMIIHNPTADAAASVPYGIYGNLQISFIPPGPHSPPSQCE